MAFFTKTNSSASWVGHGTKALTCPTGGACWTEVNEVTLGGPTTNEVAQIRAEGVKKMTSP